VESIIFFDDESGTIVHRSQTADLLYPHAVIGLPDIDDLYRVVSIEKSEPSSIVHVVRHEGNEYLNAAEWRIRDDPNAHMVRSADGTAIVMHHLGGDGPPLVISHATGFHGRCYRPLGAALASHFSVWAIDYRGHGDSEAPHSGDFSWSRMAEDLSAVVDKLGGGPVRAFGHSMGGSSVLLLEAMRAGTVSGAFLFEPIVFPAGPVDSHPGGRLIDAARNRREVFNSRAEALHRYAGRAPLNSLRADSLAEYVQFGFRDLADGTVRLACRAEHEAASFEDGVRMTLDRFADVMSEVTVAAGKATTSPGPADHAAALVEALPSARLIQYDHLHHFGPLHVPEHLAADIIRLLS